MFGGRFLDGWDVGAVDFETGGAASDTAQAIIINKATKVIICFKANHPERYFLIRFGQSIH